MALKRITVLALLGVLGAAGCGSGRSISAASHNAAAPAGFAWLDPAPPPQGFSTARLLGTTVLAYPGGWRRIHSDPGTASAALTQPRTGLVTDYLNATPRQGGETLHNWAHFRPEHNLDEGDRHEQVVASADGLRFRDGSGSCVIDRYRTSRASYQEIACIVKGARDTSVIVAAALTSRWREDAPLLEQAVSAFLA